jgi:hypothetical protein
VFGKVRTLRFSLLDSVIFEETGRTMFSVFLVGSLMTGSEIAGHNDMMPFEGPSLCVCRVVT